RLYIYIGFNGLTRMRIVGIFGIATVVAGLMLVVRKIRHREDFGWLIRRQLFACATAAYLYAVMPIDAMWVGYDVRRIMAGDPAPSVELAVHEIGPEGLLALAPLLDCDNHIIREGIRAMLAERRARLEEGAREPWRQHWTATQIAERRA